MSRPDQDGQILKGIGVSPGIRIGTAVCLSAQTFEIPWVPLLPEQIEDEIFRFEKAIQDSILQIDILKERIDRERAQDHYDILEAHQMMLRDAMIRDETIVAIRQKAINAEWALKTTVDHLNAKFEKLDAFFRSRASDLHDVSFRLLQTLMGRQKEELFAQKEDSILVAKNLTPGEATQFYSHPIRGLVMEGGGKTSHIAIIARSLEIPAVLGLSRIMQQVSSGDTLIIDGGRGLVIVRPSENQLEEYRSIGHRFRKLEATLLAQKDIPAVTLDGHRITLMANIESVEGLPSLGPHGAEGVGLFRTEFMYMDRKQPPSEEEHYRYYKKLAESCTCGPVVIRTYDIGGDKLPAYWPHHGELNPALGCRAVRSIRQDKRFFVDQVRGIFRAAAHGDIRLLLPFISGVSELDEILSLLNEVKLSLKSENIPYNPDIKLGVMIELPSAVIVSDSLATRVQFFSIGTNDLIQYALAVDRDTEQLTHLYNPLNPAILRMISMTCDSALKAGINIGMCGEMASDPRYTMLLLGLGLTELDMPPSAIPYVKEIIRNCSRSEAEDLAKKSPCLPDDRRSRTSYLSRNSKALSGNPA